MDHSFQHHHHHRDCQHNCQRDRHRDRHRDHHRDRHRRKSYTEVLKMCCTLHEEEEFEEEVEEEEIEEEKIEEEKIEDNYEDNNDDWLLVCALAGTLVALSPAFGASSFQSAWIFLLEPLCFH